MERRTSERVVCSCTSKLAKRFRSVVADLAHGDAARFQGHHAELHGLLHVLHVGLAHLPSGMRFMGMLPDGPEGMAGEEPLVWARAGATTSAAAKPPRRARRSINISLLNIPGSAATR